MNQPIGLKLQQHFTKKTEKIKKSTLLGNQKGFDVFPKEVFAQFLFNHYHYLIHSAHHVSEAMESSKRKNADGLTRLFYFEPQNTHELEKNILLAIDSLNCEPHIISQLQRTKEQKELLKFINWLTTFDPEGFLVFQLFIHHVSQELSSLWNKQANIYLNQNPVSFNLGSTYSNLSRKEFKNPLLILNEVISEDSFDRIIENLDRVSTLLLKYLKSCEKNVLMPPKKILTAQPDLSF